MTKALRRQLPRDAPAPAVPGKRFGWPLRRQGTASTTKPQADRAEAGRASGQPRPVAAPTAHFADFAPSHGHRWVNFNFTIARRTRRPSRPQVPALPAAIGCPADCRNSLAGRPSAGQTLECGHR